MSIILVSTLHDPQGLMVSYLKEHLTALRTLYAGIYIVATPVTHTETVAVYRAHDCIVSMTGGPDIGTARRQALALGRDSNSAADFIHYCDADRILHWQMHYPAELAALVTDTISTAAYCALGRTERAYNTHPLVQREAEYVCNRVYAIIAGKTTQTLDVCAGSSAMSRAAAEHILAHSVEPTNATDAEWPMLIERSTLGRVRYIKTEGLEFETPTFVGPNVITSSHNADNWAKRVRLGIDSFESALRVALNPPAG